ncbi:hypothetical protein A9746_08125, partial [Campylobacter upsaliensis]|nr:hypothetical protein [Campylobacter upsaliensis]
YIKKKNGIAIHKRGLFEALVKMFQTILLSLQILCKFFQIRRSVSSIKLFFTKYIYILSKTL